MAFLTADEEDAKLIKEIDNFNADFEEILQKANKEFKEDIVGENVEHMSLAPGSANYDMMTESLAENAEVATPEGKVTNAVFTQIQDAYKLERLRTRIGGQLASTAKYKDKAHNNKMYSEAYEKMRGSKFQFRNLRPVAGMVRKILSSQPGADHARAQVEATVFCLHLYSFVVAKSLKDHALFVSELIERIYRAAEGKQDEPLAAGIRGLVGYLEEKKF
jgi:hypothetical protein